MEDRLELSVTAPKDLRGGTAYTVVVHARNRSDEKLEYVSVEPQDFIGRPIDSGSSAPETESSVLQSERDALVHEMNKQVLEAFRRERHRSDSTIQKLARMASIINPIARLGAFTIELSDPTTPPNWATLALTIREYNDVKRLQDEIINKEPEDSFLRRAYQINKDKLLDVMTKIAEAEKTEKMLQNLQAKISIAPRESRSFPLKFVSPRFWRAASAPFKCQVHYQLEKSDIAGATSIQHELQFEPWAGAVPVGAALGSVMGTGVKLFLAYEEGNLTSLSAVHASGLAASFVLATLLAFILRRPQVGRKWITVEDLNGGVLVGTICGLYSSQVVEFLRQFVPKLGAS